jgi:hypothetical protein
MASVYVFHQILIRFGISRSNAVFGALALALSPVFFVLSTTYMTDVPGLFCTLVCIYFCLRAVSGTTDRAALAWLSIATLSTMGGATVRQVVWLGVLVVVPSTAWLLRKRPRVFWGGALLWVIGIVSFLAYMHWLDRQPYFVPETIVPHGLRSAYKRVAVKEAINLSRAFLCLLLLMFPVLAAWFSLVRFVPRRSLVWVLLVSSILLTGFLFFCYRHGRLDAWLAPWLAHVLVCLSIPGPEDIPGPKPGSTADWPQMVLTALVVSSALIFFLHVFSRLRAGVHMKEADRRFWQQMFWLLAPYTAGYTGALMLEVLYQNLFDRYLLSVQALAIIVLLRYYQDFAAQDAQEGHSRFTIRSIPTTSWITLLAFAFFGITGTHDWFAVHRARLKAADEVRRSGVPRTAIQAGFEYDAWTQLEAAGHLNSPLVKIPPGAFHSVPPDQRPECGRAWLPYYLTPAVVPQYFVVYKPLPCLAASPFPSVTYQTWRPPFTRHLWVQQRTE